MGLAIAKAQQTGQSAAKWLWIGLGVNILLLAFFKYLTAFGQKGLLWLNIPKVWLDDLSGLAVPIGLSYVTFQLIAYLVDVRRRQAVESHFGNYLLFVTYFPHLIAGPILHHAQMMPQFRRQRDIEALRRDSAAGMTLFALGLAKKVLLADTVAEYATPYFNAVAAGHALSAEQAWAGALAYTLQLYFDFSGYCDMATGER